VLSVEYYWQEVLLQTEIVAIGKMHLKYDGNEMSCKIYRFLNGRTNNWTMVLFLQIKAFRQKNADKICFYGPAVLS